MLSLGVFPAPPQLYIIPVAKHFLFPVNRFNGNLSLSGNVAVTGQIRPRFFCASASKIQRNRDIEVDNFNDDEDFDEFEEEDIDEDEDDEEAVVPLKDMKRWLENKPRGFGEGREYDTSIEDKLFDEMERSRLAQLANLNKLKNNPQPPNSKNQPLLQNNQKELGDVSGIRVRLANLPKKKNIHRDLQLAFKGIPGIIKIVPAVSGNKKTREPICKGIAFVYFKSQDSANRFVDMFSKEKIAFGKVQKQIKCEIVKSSSLDSEEPVDKRIPGYQLAVISSEKSPVLKANYVTNGSFDSPGETFYNESAKEDEVVITTWKDTKESLENSLYLGPSKQQVKTHPPEITVSANGEKLKDTGSNKKQEKTKKKVKIVDKTKRKLSIPGSANRLKGKEKNVLTDVFSKYGAQKSFLAVKEQI